VIKACAIFREFSNITGNRSRFHTITYTFLFSDRIILVRVHHQTYLTVGKSSPSNPKLQGSYCTDCPTHGLPPLLGTGFVHVRVRCLTPAHASAEHSVQVSHTLQLPCCTPNNSHASLPSHPTLTSTAKARKHMLKLNKAFFGTNY